VQEERLRSLIREEFKRKLSHSAFGEEFEYVLMETNINELDISGGLGSLLGFVGDNIPEAGMDAFKQYLLTQLFQFLDGAGLPLDPNSIFGGVLINVIEQLKWTQLSGYLDDEGCEKLTDDVLKGVQEGLIQENVMNEIAAVFFGPEFRLGGVIGGPIRELINIKLQEMTESLRQPLISFICDHRDMEKLFSDFKGMTKSGGSAGGPVTGGASSGGGASQQLSPSDLYTQLAKMD